MSNKVELLKYRQVDIPVDYRILLDDKDEVLVLKDGKPITIPEITGKNVYDLIPSIDFDDVIHRFETNKGSMAPLGKMQGIKRGVMHVVGALSNVGKSQLQK